MRFVVSVGVLTGKRSCTLLRPANAISIIRREAPSLFCFVSFQVEVEVEIESVIESS